MSQKWALVTGTSSGLGLAMAEYLLENDWKVYGGARRNTPIEHDNFFDAELDLSDLNSVSEFVHTLRDITPKLNLIVTNAGLCEMNPVEKTTMEIMQKHFSVNTFGSFELLKQLKPFMISGNTHLVTLLSTAALYSYPNVSAYGMSKSALKSLLENLQKEWKTENYKFTQLYPGAIDTPLWDGIGGDFSRSRMLSIEDFIYYFDFVVNAPWNLRLVDPIFLHKDGVLE